MVFGLTYYLGPCLRVIVLILALTLICLMYILGDYHTKFIHPVQLTTDSFTSMSPKEGFLIWTPSCQIPDIDPNHHSILKLLKIAEPITCSNTAPLTHISKSSSSDSLYKIIIDSKVMTKYVSKNQKLYCCYSVVSRINFPSPEVYNQSADNFYNVSSCTNFTKEADLPSTAEFIYVKCYKKKDGKLAKREIYKNMHSMIPIKKRVRGKIEKQKLKQTGEPKLSILLLGLDSVSRLNIMRTMSRTVSHLRHAGWVELKGYNKVGDNTFPNLMAILTGKSVKSIEQTCWPTRKNKLDDCPFIWKDFSQNDYITLYAEDQPEVSTFNYHKTGFVQPPTDYYFRPYMLAAENLLSKVSRDGLHVCAGPVSTTDHILNYLSNFLTSFKDFLSFSLVWINNFSHNNHNTPAAMDLRFVHFFDELAETGIMNSTMIVFFSDHGMRFGKIRETYVGWLEERLPFIFVWVPEVFRHSYPNYFHNLQVNGERLTTPFDLHASLKFILNRTYSGPDKKECSSNPCTSYNSLFSEPFGDRSCDNIGINPHWCTCSQYEALPLHDDKVFKVAAFVLNQIQQKLKHSVNETSNGKHCAALKLNRIVRARAKVHQVDKHPVGYDDYVIVFETVPGEAMFESTVRRYETDKYEILGFISRINSYASQSKCINDGELKLYCFCM